MIKLIAITFIVLTISSAGAFASYTFGKYLENNMNDEIDSFDTCIAAGYLVQETAPPRCMDSKGNVFVDKFPSIFGN
ncbi:MAG: hypothetical protein AAB866_02375 [Patescibacteria group bacterium]